MKAIRIILSVILTAVAGTSMAQGVIIYKSNGTIEKLPYVAVDSIIPYAGDKQPEALPDPKYVDLGLPSGTLWADRNMGAAAPEGTGGYFAWGETEEKTTYSWDSYMCTSSQLCTSSDPLWADGLVHKWYNTSGFYEGNIAGSKYDVAAQKWGEAWAMPTMEQFSELSSNCTKSTVTINDVVCVQYTGPNGNSLVIPTIGGYKENISTYSESSLYLWTATQVGSSSKEANNVTFSSYGISVGAVMRSSRNKGLQVRPICINRSAVNNK